MKKKRKKIILPILILLTLGTTFGCSNSNPTPTPNAIHALEKLEGAIAENRPAR